MPCRSMPSKRSRTSTRPARSRPSWDSVERTARRAPSSPWDASAADRAPLNARSETGLRHGGGELARDIALDPGDRVGCIVALVIAGIVNPRYRRNPVIGQQVLGIAQRGGEGPDVRVVEDREPAVPDDVEPVPGDAVLDPVSREVRMHVGHVLNGHCVAPAELDEARILMLGAEAEMNHPGPVPFGAEPGPRDPGAPQGLGIAEALDVAADRGVVQEVVARLRVTGVLDVLEPLDHCPQAVAVFAAALDPADPPFLNRHADVRHETRVIHGAGHDPVDGRVAPRRVPGKALQAARDLAAERGPYQPKPDAFDRRADHVPGNPCPPGPQLGILIGHIPADVAAFRIGDPHLRRTPELPEHLLLDKG